jgi:N6-adenosine-specific RNA methylase IME4
VFKVLCADPPWKFDDKLPGKTRGAVRQYACLSVEAICRFPLLPLADDCVLFLWKVASMPHAALDVTRMWGFTPKTELIWLKKTVNGNQFFGMGRTLRAEHETCLVATRGKPQVRNHSVRSTFITDFEGLSAPVGRHSEKPDRFYQIVESLFDGPYLELFGRKQRPGWTVLGDESCS